MGRIVDELVTRPGFRGNSPIPAAPTHDGLFKVVFSQAEHAMAFFKSHLPPEIVAWIDWPSLMVRPGSFIKSSLQQVRRRKSVE
jgi:hypothetical protein